ncbi:MAG: response regulator [Povalibacter sp.]
MDNNNRKPQIAVVDDEPAIRKSLVRLLGAAGLQVHVYASGRDMLDACKTMHFDCVLMDLQMPGLNGFEVFEELRRADFRMPVILMTASGDPVVQKRASELGFELLLLKPLDGELLLSSIRNLVGRVALKQF